MVRRGICKRCVAPIWAWHSCGAVGQPPDQSDIEALLPCDGSTGVRIELDVPLDLVVLSNYGAWDDVLDQSIDAADARCDFAPSIDDWHRVFDVNLSDREPWAGENHYDVQACVPHVGLEWVRNLEPYALPTLDD